MENGGQIKVGIRNAMVILLLVLVLVPMIKNAASQVTQLPEGVRNWINAV